MKALYFWLLLLLLVGVRTYAEPATLIADYVRSITDINLSYTVEGSSSKTKVQYRQKGKLFSFKRFDPDSGILLAMYSYDGERYYVLSKAHLTVSRGPNALVSKAYFSQNPLFNPIRIFGPARDEIFCPEGFFSPFALSAARKVFEKRIENTAIIDHPQGPTIYKFSEEYPFPIEYRGTTTDGYEFVWKIETFLDSSVYNLMCKLPSRIVYETRDKAGRLGPSSYSIQLNTDQNEIQTEIDINEFRVPTSAANEVYDLDSGVVLKGADWN